MAKKLLITFSLLLANLFGLFGQDCHNAKEIVIGDNGFAMGQYVSEIYDLKEANKEFGEFFPEGFDYLAIDNKTIWYKFKIVTARSVRVELRQRDSAISQNAVGMAVYSGWSCIPKQNRLEPRLIPINKFGEISTNCLPIGEYMIQVCASHKANDSIWIQLTLGEPPLDYDFKNTAHDFGKINGFVNFVIQPACLSLESTTEKNPLLPDIYEKTAWFTFESANNNSSFSLRLSPLNSEIPTDTVYAVLYKGDVRSDEHILLKDTLSFWHGEVNFRDHNKLYYKMDCFLENNQRYSIQVFFKKTVSNAYKFDLSQLSDSNDFSTQPSSLSNLFHLGNLNVNQTLFTEGQFSCGSFIKNNLCEPANSTIHPIIKDIEYDLAAWRTFTVMTESEITITPRMTLCANASFIYTRQLALRIFEGNIRDNCNLPILDTITTGSHTICLKPGVYSLQILGLSNIPITSTSQFNVNLCYVTFLGEQFRITIQSKLGEKPIPSMYGNPKYPENLGNITPILNNSQTVIAKLDYLNKRHFEDTLKINSCKNRVYREFYLSEPTALQFARIGSDAIFLKGRISLGMDSLQIIANRIGTIVSFQTFGMNCERLDSGWYSLIGCGNINENCLGNYYELLSNSVEIKKVQGTCRNFSNSVPTGSISLNPTENDLLKISNTPSNGTDLDFIKRYNPGNNCIACDTTHADFINKIYYSCVQNPDTIRFKSAFFFHFKTEIISDFEISDYRRVLLFKGDYRNDSLGLLDPKNRIRSCSNEAIDIQRRYYCGIEPGFYTLIILNHQIGASNYTTLWYDNHVKPKFDHVQTAYQFGELNSGIEVTSPTDVISCMTAAHREHPGLQNLNENNFLIYPLEQHKKQLNWNIRRNLWYTFTTKGSGEVQITLENRSRNSGAVNYIVYESSSDASIPFDLAYNQGLIDSNINMGLKQITLQSGRFKFGNFCLDDTSVVRRYFIVASISYTTYNSPYLKKFIRFKVKLTSGLDDKSSGDYCVDANLFNVSGIGSFTSPNYSLNCHTMGEGFGEDGSNLACLSPGVPFKTTWVKISVANIIKGDISFSITPNLIPANNNQLLRYRVLYGDCGSLTPGPCVSFWGSSFRLDCMPPGDYFIQVATPIYAKGTFNVNVEVTPSLYPDCKPASLFEPFANFNFTPPCNDSVVHFQNWSTAGEDISYFWDFGNGITSTEKNPTITFNHSKEIDTFTVKLIISNNVHQSKDSTTKILRIFRDPLISKIEIEKDSFCSGFIELSLKSNFSPVSNISWIPSPNISNDSLNLVRFFTNINQDLFIKVSSSFNECKSFDSILFGKQKAYSFISDTITCAKESILFDLTDIVNEKGITEISWYDFSSDFVKTISDTGTFWMQLKKEGCVWYDTFRITYPFISDSITPKYNFACNGTFVELEISQNLSNPLWSTGEQTHKILVDTSGLYNVSAYFNNCILLDSFEVEIPIIPNLLGFSDTIKCIEESITINLNNPNYEFKWFDGSESADYTVWDTGEYWVRITDRACDTVFRFSVTEYPSTLKLLEDTTLCELVPIILDAGEGRSFFWIPTNEVEQTIKVHDFGKYSITKVNNFGCVETDTFMLSRYCGPKLFIPNAFSPNGDGLNDMFLPYNESLISFRMIIFNRWGEQLFETKSTSIGWDGTFGGVKCQDGVYTYIIWYSMEDEGKLIDVVTKGTVTLFR